MTKPKRRTREINKTRLIVCEGVSDKKFLERVKSLIATRDGGLRVSIDSSGGGGPKGVLNTVLNTQGLYDTKYMLVDSDIPITQAIKKTCDKRDIKIVQSIPFCLEGMLLKASGFKQEIRSSKHAKEEMSKRYGLGITITEQWYEEYLTKEFLLSVIEDKTNPASDVFRSIRGMFLLSP